MEIIYQKRNPFFFPGATKIERAEKNSPKQNCSSKYFKIQTVPPGGDRCRVGPMPVRISRGPILRRLVHFPIRSLVPVAKIPRSNQLPITRRRREILTRNAFSLPLSRRRTKIPIVKTLPFRPDPCIYNSDYKIRPEIRLFQQPSVVRGF